MDGSRPPATLPASSVALPLTVTSGVGTSNNINNLLNSDYNHVGLNLAVSTAAGTGLPPHCKINI